MSDKLDRAAIIEKRLLAEAGRLSDEQEREVTVQECRQLMLEYGLDRQAERQEAKRRQEDLQTDLLLVTATQAEHRAMSRLLREGGYQTSRVRGHQTYTSVGGLGDWKVKWLKAELGALGPASAATACTLAAIETRASVAFLVGIAFGTPLVQLGDVLVSSKVCLYDGVTVRQEAGSVLARCRPRQVFQADTFWSREITGAGAGLTHGVHRGLLLSGGALIESALHRDALTERAMDATQGEVAVGGEMEAAAILTAFERWVVVKGVCDLADGASRVEAVVSTWRTRAASNAISLTLSAIDKTSKNPDDE